MIVVGGAIVGIYLLLHDYCADCIRPPTLSKIFVESDTRYDKYEYINKSGGSGADTAFARDREEIST